VNKSIVWTAAAVATVGFGVPAFAAISSPGHIRQIAPTPVVSVDKPDSTVSTIDDSTTLVTLVSSQPDTSSSTPNSVEDVSGNCDEAEHANDIECAGANPVVVPDTSTPNSVEDVSGNCDEAEHADDPDCTGTGGPSDDNSGSGSSNSGHGSNSGSGNSGSNSGHGSDDSGSDNSGHGGGDD
jgi:hypothetical protein